jgi:Subtilase family
MTLTTKGPIEYDDRQRVRDQVAMIERAHGGNVAYDSADPADYKYLYVPNRLLVAGEEDRDRLDAAVTVDRVRELDAIGASVTPEEEPRRAPGLFRYALSFRAGSRGTFEDALRILDRELGAGVVTPDHYVHVSSGIGGSKPCPATEPAETGLGGPWPPLTDDAEMGTGVTVAVVDTGWHPRAATEQTTKKYLGDDVKPARSTDREPYPANRELSEYAGHGTFIAGVVRCRAPKARIRHFRYGNGGAVPESVLVEHLHRTLRQDPQPDIIVLSAGCQTRRDQELNSFRHFWQETLSGLPGTVLVAAAGNDGCETPFYPAAHPWAVGVGSLDRDEQVSSFSNFGPCADVFVLGRNHVNAYPRGHYVCKEPPDVGDERQFNNGLARWSGTSFAAPLFAGLLARRLTTRRGRRTATDIAWQMIDRAAHGPDPDYGSYRVIHPRTWN